MGTVYLTAPSFLCGSFWLSHCFFHQYTQRGRDEPVFGVINYSVSQINMPAVLVANGLGSCLMLAVLLSRHRRVRMVSFDGKLFYLMCLLCLTLCMLETTSFALDGKLFAGALELAMFLNCLSLALAVTLAFLWVCYVDFRLFRDRHRLHKRYSIGGIPAVLIAVLAFCNLFFNIFFGVTSDNNYYRTPLFLLPCLVIYGYMTYGAILSCRSRSQMDQYLFMPAMSFLVPIYVGSMIQLLNYGIALIWASVALGLILLYINLQSEEIFLDPLTNLYNRNYLVHHMDRLCRQVAPDHSITGILLDVNNFKYINDTYGHIKGDAVLRAMGEILLRATDQTQAVVARYGGDEFLILLHSAQPESLQQITDSIQRELQAYNASNHTLPPLSVSAGIATLVHTDVFSFFQDMDAKMYADKKAFYLRGEAEDPAVPSKE